MSQRTQKHASGPLGRISIAGLLFIALVLIVLGVLAAAYPSITFVRNFMIGSLQPLEIFDSGEQLNFVDEEPYSSYYLSMEVDERNADLPEMQIEILTSDGTPPVTSPINRWNSMMGREYKQFLVIEPPADGRLSITVSTPENEDFLIYRSIEDVFEREIRRAMPLWLLAALPFLGAVAMLGLVLMRLINTSSKVDLRIE